MSLPVIVQQVVAQLYFLDYKRDTPAFAIQFPLLGLARDFPRLDSAHAKRTKRELAVQVFPCIARDRAGKPLHRHMPVIIVHVHLHLPQILMCQFAHL